MNTLFHIYSRYTAARITPMSAAAAKYGPSTVEPNAPSRIVNSPTKPFRPVKPIRAQLQHDPGQDDRTGSRGLNVGIGQPRVQRPDRNFDGEGHEEAQEQ